MLKAEKVARALLALVTIAFASAACAQNTPACSLASAQTAVAQRDNYTMLKALEGCFQVPASSATVNVGTFNAATGAFTYAPQITQKQMRVPITSPVIANKGVSEPPENGRTVIVPAIVGMTSANAANVSLVFQSANNTAFQVATTGLGFSDWNTASGQVSCDQNGYGVCPWPSRNQGSPLMSQGPTATVNVGQAFAVMFTLTAGVRSYTGYVLILRPPVIGLGAFTIPAIPISIIYAPPLGVLKKNSNSYSLGSTTGTVVTTSISQDNSTTTPVGDFSSPFGIAGQITGILSQVLKVLPSDPGIMSTLNSLGGPVGVASTALNMISQGLGSQSETLTQGATVKQDHTLTVTVLNQDSWRTGDVVGGPGLEDLFIFLKDAKIMWVAQKGQLQLSLIGYTLDVKAAHYLLENKDNPNGFAGLDSKTIKSLLRLDAFTAPYVDLPYSPSWEASGSLQPGPIPPTWVDLFPSDLGYSDVNPQTIQTSYTVSQADTSVHTSYTTDIKDMKAGWMAFMGLGVQQTQTTKSTATTSLSTADVTGQQTSPSAQFFLAPNEPLVLETYYDSVFGTYAFVQQPSSPQPVYSGVASSPAGQPLPHQAVVLQIGSRKYVTRTDAQGRYAFHAKSIQRGANAILHVGSVSKPVAIMAPPAPGKLSDHAPAR